jgi:glutathione S-transferase
MDYFLDAGMITLHHLENSRSQRILWLLEELQLDYEIKFYERDKDTQLAPPELKKVHPLGKSPVLEDKGKVLAESGCIIDYLCRKYGKDWLPRRNSGAYTDCQFWLHYAEGSVMSPLLMQLVFDKVKTAPMPFFIRPIAKGIADKVLNSFVRPNIKTHFDYIEQHLADKTWFLGDNISAADIQMSFPLSAALSQQQKLVKNYPNITAWVKRFQARPAYQKALKAGGEYDYELTEF